MKIGKGFAAYINEYRIREACKLMVNDHGIKLEAIGYEVRFNFKSTFYTRFKRHKNYCADMNDETEAWFMQNIEATDKLFNARKLSEVIPKKYDAVYFAGGHGVMWDLSKDSTSEMITRTIYENNG